MVWSKPSNDYVKDVQNFVITLLPGFNLVYYVMFISMGYLSKDSTIRYFDNLLQNILQLLQHITNLKPCPFNVKLR